MLILVGFIPVQLWFYPTGIRGSWKYIMKRPCIWHSVSDNHLLHTTVVDIETSILYLLNLLVMIKGTSTQKTASTSWYNNHPDSKVHGANMGPTWVLSASDGPMLAPWTLLSGHILRLPLYDEPGYIVDATFSQYDPSNILVHPSGNVVGCCDCHIFQSKKQSYGLDYYPTLLWCVVISGFVGGKTNKLVCVL